MRKIFTFLLFALWLPATALAAENVPATLIVGGTDVKSGGYWTTGTDGKLTSGSESSWNVHYDASANTLNLNGATIAGANSESTLHNTVGIYASSSSGDVSLTISLQGENTITSNGSGIYVYSSATGNASLTISGSGSLNANGSQNGILDVSNGGDAALTIQNAVVEATVSSSGNGVLVQAGGTSSASLTVNGGGLTATGSGTYGTGIYFSLGSGDSGSGTSSLNVSNNAIVRASGNAGGIASNATAATPSGTGIVFNGNDGTVYGDVTLQEDLEIGEGESLTIGDGASLTIGNGATLTVNGGELKGNVPQSGVVYKVTGVSLDKTSLTLEVGDSETLTATITPDNATEQDVTWSSAPSNIVTITPNENDSKTATITATGTGSTTITATVDGKSARCEVPVNKATPTYTVPTGLTATYGQTLEDVELPDGWSWQNAVKTPVGNVGDNTFTAIFTPDDTDNYNTVENIEVTVTVSRADISEQIKAEGKTTISLDLETGSTEVTAIVEGDDIWAGGTWRWISEDASVATVTPKPTTRATFTKESTATITAVGAGTTTITATYATANFSGSVSYTLTVTKAEDPDTPIIPDMPDYYNIMVEECEGVTVETSTNVVREGQSMTFTIDVAEGYTSEDMTVKVKRSLFGYTEVIEPNDEGIYEVKNIYTDIYLTVDGVEEETPTGMEDVESAKVYTKDGSLYVETSQRVTVSIVSMTGAVVEQSEQIGQKRYDLPRGIYILCIGEQRYKVRN